MRAENALVRAENALEQAEKPFKSEPYAWPLKSTMFQAPMQHVRARREAPGPDTNPRQRFTALLEHGVAKARTLGRPILVSATESIAPIEPLDALDHAGSTQMYWAVPRDNFALAGAGTAATLTGSGSGRYSDVARAWARLLDEAIMDRPARAVPAAGPDLMGGFAFESEGPNTAEWLGFPAADFVVPSVAVARRGAGCRLTLNALVDDNTNVDAVAGEMATQRERVASIRSSKVPAAHTSDLARRSEPAPLDYSESQSPDEWRAMVRRAVNAIQCGDLEKVVLAREVIVQVGDRFDVIAALRHLRSAQGNAFVFGIWRGDAVFFGATPERLVRLHGREVATSVLAGSAPRGDTPVSDAALAQRLLASAKDRNEHEIVRRDLHAALEEVCDGVAEAAEPSLVTLPHVHHLHTAVRARLREGRSVFDVIERLHPTPAVGGAPRAAALEFLRRHEGLDRGWYAAPIGWVARGQAEFAVALRAAVVRRGRASLFAGCGIVAQSDPDAEYAEAFIKLLPAMEALAAGTPDP